MESVGARLKKIRQEQGVSLEEVQKKTKIRLNILKAIEGDGLTNLSPVYLRGFLKIYCNFLGLSPREFLADYKETQGQPKPIGIDKEVPEKAEKATSFLKAVSVKLSAFRPSKKIKSVSKFILIIIFLSLVMFNLGRIISSWRKEHSVKERVVSSIKMKTESKETEISQKVKSSTVIPKPQEKQATPQKETMSGMRLDIRAKENCWVLLKVDGRVVFQRVLEKGRSESWQAKEKMELSLGNAGGVELEVNGKLFSNLGRRGQVRKNILITKEGLNIGR